ncbi:hypothetical protein [Vreelandella utahensis]|uniref:hypothetical protein n=1 Tax=Vreelandella halophila TaxID=86177 RepID=UPI0009856ED9|nr:hypothetical protein [Halomonas utahensis]
MSDNSPIIVERLWRLKRGIEKGQCDGLAFAHLNNLLRNPAYRDQVLTQVERDGTDAMKELASEIRSLDEGAPLMGSSGQAQQGADADADRQGEQASGASRRYGVWILAAITAALAGLSGFTAWNERTRHIDSDITAPTTWTSGHTYVLEDRIFVRDTSLTIEPGARVEGRTGSALIVTRGGTLAARGSRNQPVVFTSHEPEGSRQSGDWGGVVLLGSAPVNQPNAHIEGVDAGTEAGRFGGEDPRSNCGVITHARIEFAGHEVYSNNELNGLTMGGCGTNTIIRNVQVHRPLDDGIEMFGGTVDLKNVLVSGPGDDGIDWDWGWTGRVQFAIIQQHPDTGDNAFEGDNNGDHHQASPRSEPRFYNVTLAGAGGGLKLNRGMVLREGTGGHFHNMIVDGYGLGAVDTRHEVSALVGSGKLTFTNNLISDSGEQASDFGEKGDRDDDFGFKERDWLRTADFGNAFRMGSALLAAARDIEQPRFSPVITQKEMNAVAPPQDEFFDESALFLGAIDPAASEPWTTDWTAFPRD